MAVSSAPTAVTVRATVVQTGRQGRSDQQIEGYLVARYGSCHRARPAGQRVVGAGVGAADRRRAGRGAGWSWCWCVAAAGHGAGASTPTCGEGRSTRGAGGAAAVPHPVAGRRRRRVPGRRPERCRLPGAAPARTWAVWPRWVPAPAAPRTAEPEQWATAASSPALATGTGGAGPTRSPNRRGHRGARRADGDAAGGRNTWFLAVPSAASPPPWSWPCRSSRPTGCPARRPPARCAQPQPAGRPALDQAAAVENQGQLGSPPSSTSRSYRPTPTTRWRSPSSAGSNSGSASRGPAPRWSPMPGPSWPGRPRSTPATTPCTSTSGTVLLHGRQRPGAVDQFRRSWRTARRPPSVGQAAPTCGGLHAGGPARARRGAKPGLPQPGSPPSGPVRRPHAGCRPVRRSAHVPPPGSTAARGSGHPDYPASGDQHDLPPMDRSIRDSVMTTAASSRGRLAGAVGWRRPSATIPISSSMRARLPSGSLNVQPAPVHAHHGAVVEEDLVERDRGDRPRGEPDHAVPPEVPGGPQRRLGVVAADRVDDHVDAAARTAPGPGPSGPPPRRRWWPRPPWPPPPRACPGWRRRR